MGWSVVPLDKAWPDRTANSVVVPLSPDIPTSIHNFIQIFFVRKLLSAEVKLTGNPCFAPASVWFARFQVRALSPLGVSVLCTG